jgi:hypothetical protein
MLVLYWWAAGRKWRDHRLFYSFTFCHDIRRTTLFKYSIIILKASKMVDEVSDKVGDLLSLWV